MDEDRWIEHPRGVYLEGIKDGVKLFSESLRDIIDQGTEDRETKDALFELINSVEALILERVKDRLKESPSSSG